jgi:hypothetical protein
MSGDTAVTATFDASTSSAYISPWRRRARERNRRQLPGRHHVRLFVLGDLNWTFAMPVAAAASAVTTTLEETGVRCPGAVTDTVTGGGAR